jgi:hypothetical protein
MFTVIRQPGEDLIEIIGQLLIVGDEQKSDDFARKFLSFTFLFVLDNLLT